MILVLAEFWMRQKSPFKFFKSYAYLTRFLLFVQSQPFEHTELSVFPGMEGTHCSLWAGSSHRRAHVSAYLAAGTVTALMSRLSLKSGSPSSSPSQRKRGPMFPELTLYRWTDSYEGTTQDRFCAFVLPICAKQSEYLDNTSWLIASWFTPLFDLLRFQPQVWLTTVHRLSFCFIVLYLWKYWYQFISSPFVCASFPDSCEMCLC